MRDPRPVLLLAALLLAAMPAAGQSAPADPELVTIGDDAGGDVKMTAQGVSQAAPEQTTAHLDLLQLTFQEQRDQVVLTVRVKDLKVAQDAAGRDGAVIDVFFTHEARQFRARMLHTLPGAMDFTGASLSYRDSEGAPWNELWFRSGFVALDDKAETYSVTLARGDLADAKGAAPFPGRSLTGFHVVSENPAGGNIQIFVVQAESLTFSDRLPDTGVAAKTYEVRLGIQQTGHARLTSPEPFRASNGEATTLLLKAQAHNLADHPDRFQLRATRLPAGWSVVLPVPTVDLEPKSSLDVPVVVSVPFSHTHGSAAAFVLEMTSLSDPNSVGRVELGVRYLSIPQPAGHHNLLHLHSRPYNDISRVFGHVFTGNDGYPFMNTVADYEGDAKIPLSPQGSWLDDGPGGQPYAVYSWCTPLDPGLQMGLDFVMGAKGRLKVNVQATVPMQGAVLSARLLLVPDDSSRFGCYGGFGMGDPMILATLNTTQPVDIGATSQVPLEGELEIWQSADRIPYVKGQNLLLYIQVSALTTPQFFLAQGSPRLMPGSELELPLLDYHDDVKAVLTTAAGPGLVPLGPQQRLANPGSTIAFPLAVSNDGSDERTIAFNVTGTNSAWATLPGSVEIGAHSTEQVEVIVRVPQDARDGDVADLIVQAVDGADQSGRGLLRLLVTVQTGTTVEDDEVDPVAGPSRSSPGVAVGALATLALAALGARRRWA